MNQAKEDGDTAVKKIIKLQETTDNKIKLLNEVAAVGNHPCNKKLNVDEKLLDWIDLQGDLSKNNKVALHKIVKKDDDATIFHQKNDQKQEKKVESLFAEEEV